MKPLKTPDVWKRIVVPTDFSDFANAAVAAAAEFHQRTGAEIVLLHVTEPAHEGLRVQTGELHQRLKHAAEDELGRLSAKCFPHAKNVRQLVIEGRPAEVICRTASDEQADAILIPTHGRSGLKHALLGSVAERVVRHAPCSVLVMRE